MNQKVIQWFNSSIFKIF